VLEWINQMIRAERLPLGYRSWEGICRLLKVQANVLRRSLSPSLASTSSFTVIITGISGSSFVVIGTTLCDSMLTTTTMIVCCTHTTDAPPSPPQVPELAQFYSTPQGFCRQNGKVAQVCALFMVIIGCS
jgi:hypothetical protein